MNAPPRAGVIAIALLALIVRLPFFFGSHEYDPGSDSEFYFAAADSITSGDGFPGHFWVPGYSAFIGLLSALPGRDEDVVTVVQHLLGMVVAATTFHFTRRWFGTLAAVAAGGLAAIGPVLVIHEHTLLPDFLFGVLVFAGALVLAEACGRDDAPVRWLVAAGILFGLATWVKPAGQFLLIAAPLPLLLATRDWRRALRGSAVVAVALVLTILPWIVRNEVRFDHLGMNNQGGATLFNRAFEVTELPIPPDQEHGALAAEVRAAGGGERFHVAFHRALVDREGLTDAEAWAEQRRMASHAIWTYPRLYATDSMHLLGDSLDDIRNFNERDELEEELDATDPPVPGGFTKALWDLSRWAHDIWWILALSGFGGLLVLLAPDRRSRAAGAALLSVWLAVVAGTVLSHGGLWRYSIQVAPLTYILGSAGAAILVKSLIGSLRRAGSRA